MNAAECKKILTKILEAFDMTLSDVVGITTDAAPVMVLMGKFIKLYCINWKLIPN